LRLHRIGLTDQLDQSGGDDLPGQSEFVLQPATGSFFPALRKLVPK
jgi:hypothetical protein